MFASAMGNASPACASKLSCGQVEAQRPDPEEEEEDPQYDGSERVDRSGLGSKDSRRNARSVQDDRAGTPSISRAAVQAAAKLETRVAGPTMSMEDARSVEDPVMVESELLVQAKPAKGPQKKLQLPPGAIIKQVHEIEVSSSDSDTSGGTMASKKSRTPKRRAWKRLSITETMPVSPSSALQIVINNPGKLESFYSLDKGKILGKGSFGVVKRAYVSATMAQRAVKFIAIERMKEKLNVLKQEIEIMKMVDHPNIIMLYEIFEDQQYLCLVMELCSGGSLLSRLKFSGHFSEEHTAMAMRQILRAVFYLHRNWICHRDLKAENVLVSTGEVLDKTLLKVSDFGLSCPFRPKQVLTEKVGTLTHMSPEVLDRKYTQSCDVWACGIIMYNLICGNLPFGKEEEIKRCHIAFTKYWCDASQDAVVFVKKLLSRAPQRPSAKNALQDNFILKNLPTQTEFPARYGLLDELKTFRSQNRLKRAALTTIASLLNDDHVKAARDLFISMDHDGDGQISVAEVEKELRVLKEQGIMDKDMNRREVERVFRDWDTDNSGAMLKDFSYTEFLAATFCRKTCLTDAVCREAFNTLDKNKDGLLDLNELHTGRMLGHVDMEELKETLEDLDQNGDSLLDCNEFITMLRTTTSAKTPRASRSNTNTSFGLRSRADTQTSLGGASPGTLSAKSTGVAETGVAE